MSGEKDTVPGLGFKDKDKALETIKNLEGRDPDYQKLAVKGLIGRAKRTLQVTKAEDKVTNIKEAVTVFEKWLKDFEKLHIPNWSYLPLDTVNSFVCLCKHFELSDKKTAPFLAAYKSVDGDYKKLRTVGSGDEQPTWDIVRNTELKELVQKYEDDDLELWEDDVPTKIHTQLLMWAYSPDASKIKKNLASIQSKLEKFKTDDEATDNGDAKKTNKRKSEGNSSSDEEESPAKKSKE